MNLLIAVLASVTCFVTGSFLMVPRIRSKFPSEGIAAFFFFEGIWIALNHIIAGIWPANYVMDIINYVCIIIFGIVIIFTFITKSGSESENKFSGIKVHFGKNKDK